MSSQVELPSKGFTTLGTIMRFFARMNNMMCSQAAPMSKSLSTTTAFKRFLSRMNATVHSQAALMSKSLVGCNTKLMTSMSHPSC